MRTATSASRTCRAPASASEYTATERIPRARRVRMTRQAISPRLATRTVPNRGVPVAGVAGGVTAEGVVGEERVIAGSHPEQAEGGLRQRGAGDDVERQSQDGAGVRGVDHAVVPEAGGGVIGAALVLVLGLDRGLERLLVRGGPFLAAGLVLVPFDRGQHAGGLVAAHHRDPRRRPHPQEARRVGPPAHRVVAGAEGPANYHRELGDPGGSDG